MAGEASQGSAVASVGTYPGHEQRYLWQTALLPFSEQSKCRLPFSSSAAACHGVPGQEDQAEAYRTL